MRTLLASLALTALAACGPPSEPATSRPTTAPPAPTASVEEQQQRIAALPAPYNAATYDAGRRAFGQCRSCHTLDAGGGNRVGPNLHGVFGRNIGTAPDFTYSQAVQDANFVWTAEQLDHWLQNPQTFLPGNRMAFAGVRNDDMRRDLIAYLMVESAPE